MSEPLQLTPCPYCKVHFYDPEGTIVCEKCEPLFERDMVVDELARAVGSLRELDPKIVKEHVNLLKEVLQLCQDYIKEVEDGTS